MTGIHPFPSLMDFLFEGRNTWRARGTRLIMDLSEKEREIIERAEREREMMEHEDEKMPILEHDAHEITPASDERLSDDDTDRGTVTVTVKGKGSQNHLKKDKVETSSEAGVNNVKEHNGFISQASMTLMFLIELLLVGSVVGLALLTAGSLMFGGGIITMATGLPLLFSMTFLISPLFVSISPVLSVLGTGIFLAALGLLLVVAFGFFLYSLILWIYDYMVGRNPPGSREIAALNNRTREVYVHVTAYSAHRYLEWKSSVAEYYQSVRKSIKESAELFKLTFKVLGTENRRKDVIKKPTKDITKPSNCKRPMSRSE